MLVHLRNNPGMSEHPTVIEALDEVRRYRRRRRCPECAAIVSVRGLPGNHWWTCTGCDAAGLGYATRAAATADLTPEPE